MLDLQNLFIPIVILVVVLGFLIALMLLSRNYIKVSPNQAAVISGRSRKLADGTKVGYRLVRGGATLIVPFLEKVEYLSLNVLTVPLATTRAYTVQGVPVSVKAVANVKIKGDDESMRSAAERFLGMKPEEFHKLVFQTLEGHLRAILGTLTVEEINNDRQSFAQKLTTEAAGDLEKMGIGLDALTIQEISDEEGYLDARDRGQAREVRGRDQAREGDRRAGRAAGGRQGPPGGRRRGGAHRAHPDAGADRRPGAGGPPPGEGARGDGRQEGRGRTARRRPARPGRAGGRHPRRRG